MPSAALLRSGPSCLSWFRRGLGGLLLPALLLFLAAAADAAETKLQLRYGDRKVDLSPAEFARLKPTEVEARDHEQAHRFRGVSIRDLLLLVDGPLGDNLRRPTLSLVVRITGADGFVCAFALAEFEAGFTDRTIILATHADGAPLSAEIGPWRVIAPKDTRLARWIRQVVSLEIISIANDAGTGDAAQPDTAAARAKEHLKFVPR
jgi:hypothetical protein